MIKYVWLIPLFPLIGMTINGLFGFKYIKNRAHWIAVPALGLAWLFSILVFIDVLHGHVGEVNLWDWIVTPDVHVRIAFWVDQLTAVMLMVVTTLSFWIHVYSIGYMGHDPGYPRYFTYLNMFVFFMLILVLGSSYLLLFVGWEGVGLCSYLLIGFWYERESAWKAGMKAFITNRVGDAFFVIGMFILWYYLGSLDFKVVFEKAHHYHLKLLLCYAVSFHGGYWKIGTNTLVCMASRRNGRSHSGVSLDSRCYHGDFWCLHGGPFQCLVQYGAFLFRGSGCCRLSNRFLCWNHWYITV